MSDLGDYSEAIVATRSRSLEINETLERRQWQRAAELQLEQVKDEVALLRWIAAKAKEAAQ